MAAYILYKELSKEDDYEEEYYRRKRLSSMPTYLNKKGYKPIKYVKDLKKYSLGTELAFVGSDGYVSRYYYLLDINKNHLKFLSSDFKIYTLKRPLTSDVRSIYVADIYKRKLIKHSHNKYPVFINNYPNPVYYAFNKWDKIIYKQSKHYKQVCKHRKYFKDNS